MRGVVRSAEFGAWLRSRRELLGLLQEDIAESTGVDRTTISRWERGRHLPPLENINVLAATLRVSPDVLLQHAGVTVMPTREDRLPRELVQSLLDIQDDPRALEIVLLVARSQRLLREHPAGLPRP